MRPVVFFFIVLVLLSACHPQQTNEVSELLLYDNTAGQLSISPASVPVESLLRLDYRAVDTVVAMTGEIVGVSMYMGRIPLTFTAQESLHHWQAELFLGACSDPKMEWRLVLTVQYEDGDEHMITQTFRSSWQR